MNRTIEQASRNKSYRDDLPSARLYEPPEVKEMLARCKKIDRLMKPPAHTK